MEQVIHARPYAGQRSSGIDAIVKPAAVMLRRISPGLGLMIVLACAMIPHPATAGNLSFLNNTPLSFFQRDDVDLMRKNALAVLESAQPNARQDWSNPRTGASGFAQVTGQFTMADGTLCKRVRVFNRAGGMEGEATYPVCKHAGRGWTINANAQPAK